MTTPLNATAGKNSVVYLDDATGMLRNVTKYCTEQTLLREPEKLETTALGSQEKSYIPGFIGSTFSIAGHYDGDPAAIWDILSTAVGASGPNKIRNFQIGDTGGDTGMVRYTGQAVVLSLDVKSDATAIVSWTASCRNVATIVRDTWP